MTIKEIMKNQILHSMNAIGIKHNKNENFDILLKQHIKLQNKMIDMKPRKFKISNEASKKIKQFNLEKEFEFIKKRIVNGEDLNPFLSKTLRKLKKNDYFQIVTSIYHFHMTTTRKRDEYFMDRSNYLMFVKIKNDCIYIVDIRKHKENNLFLLFNEMLNIIENNWAYLLKEYKLNNITPVNYSTDELKRCRKRNMSFALSTKNNVYASMGDGLCTNGNTKLYDQLMWIFGNSCYNNEINKYLKRFNQSDISSMEITSIEFGEKKAKLVLSNLKQKNNIIFDLQEKTS